MILVRGERDSHIHTGANQKLSLTGTKEMNWRGSEHMWGSLTRPKEGGEKKHFPRLEGERMESRVLKREKVSGG